MAIILIIYLKINCSNQWRRQDLLRGGTKTEIKSRGTHGGPRGRVQQLLND